MITFTGITKRFGNRAAVSDLSLTIHKGEIFGLVGPDGAGKTTVIRLLTGIIGPTAGDLKLWGERRGEEIKARIGYVPQKFSLYGDLTVGENINLLASLYGAPAATARVYADQVLGFTRLRPFKDRLADNLSGGMKQKLALAAGLIHKPELLILDEPTTGVDPVSRREFWEMLYRLNKEGTTILVSTPYMDEAELCTRIAFLHGGQIIACAPPRELTAVYPHKLLELKADTRKLKSYLTGDEILDINSFGDTYHLVVADSERAKRRVTAALAAAGVTVRSLREISPTLEDVFVKLAGEVE